MSTGNIEAALKWARNNQPESMDVTVADALAELEAIRKACAMLYAHGVVHNMSGGGRETTKALDDAADLLMNIGRAVTEDSP